MHSKGITDEGLHHIRSLSHLVYLELTCPAVTDDGLSHVADLAKLETLFLRCSVTDRGMRHLAPLTNLNFLECESRAQNSSALSWLRDEDRFDFVQMPLADVIKALESRTGLSIRLDSERLGNTGIDASDITVSAQYDKVSLRKFLDSILHPHGLNFLVQTDGLVITTIADAPPAEREIDRLKSTLPNLTRVYVSW
ncbi:MAG: hypothetical protein KJ000_14820 [Pirellulaceae bacterium]|nr:hypothetical protein [Pirellulaceae bacterium]